MNRSFTTSCRFEPLSLAHLLCFLGDVLCSLAACLPFSFTHVLPSLTSPSTSPSALNHAVHINRYAP